MKFIDILRKYPSEYKEIIQVINNALDSITEEDSKIALVWILGDFGEAIDDAPYIIETLINMLRDNKSGETIGNTRVKHTVRQRLLKAEFPLISQAADCLREAVREEAPRNADDPRQSLQPDPFEREGGRGPEGPGCLLLPDNAGEHRGVGQDHERAQTGDQHVP